MIEPQDVPDLGIVASWVGRKVTYENPDDFAEEPATVLAVDDMPHAPSAWIKYDVDGYVSYRSVDLSDLVDIETGEDGPRWGTGGPAAEVERLRVLRTASAPG